MKSKKTEDELSQLLGTGDRAGQVARVKQLLTAPIIDVVIRVDGRADQVTGLSVIGGQLSAETLYKVLDQVRDQIRQAELQAAAKKGGGGRGGEKEDVGEG